MSLLMALTALALVDVMFRPPQRHLPGRRPRVRAHDRRARRARGLSDPRLLRVPMAFAMGIVGFFGFA